VTRTAWLSAVALAGLGSTAGAQVLHYEGGLSLASGNYIFTQRTNSFTLSTGLAVSAGPVTFRGTFPVFLQNTTLVASSGSMLLPTGGASGGTVADSSAARGGRGSGGWGSLVVGDPSSLVLDAESDGFVDVPTTAVTGYEARAGDPTVGANVSFGGGPLGVLVSAGAKIPVTDTASFGTGAWDFGGSMSLSYRLGSAAVVSVDAGYWVMGDLPDLDLQNPLLLSASIAHLTRTGWGFSAAFFSSSSVVAGFPSARSVSAGILRVGARQSIGLTIGAGLTDTTPDIMLGVNWRLRLAGSY
jgi:hypothetical protein